VVEGVVVRRAEGRDIAAVAALAGELVRLHHATDPSRFFLPDRVEEGYARLPADHDRDDPRHRRVSRAGFLGSRAGSAIGG
jgi:hypothetical protein